MDTSACVYHSVPPAFWYVSFTIFGAMLVHGFNCREMFEAEKRVEIYASYHKEKADGCLCKPYEKCRAHGIEKERPPADIAEFDRIAKAQLIAEKIRKKREQMDITNAAKSYADPQHAAEEMTGIRFVASSSDEEDDD